MKWGACFAREGDSILRTITVFINADSQLDRGIVKRALLYTDNELETEESKLLFIDPENIFGIKLGSQREYDLWKKSNVGERQCKELSFKL